MLPSAAMFKEGWSCCAIQGHWRSQEEYFKQCGCRQKTQQSLLQRGFKSCSLCLHM